MRRPGEERGAGPRGRDRRRHRGGARVTWDVIRGPQDLIMGRRMEDWRGSRIEGADEGNGNKELQERASMEAIAERSSSHYVIGAQQGAQLALTRSHTDEDKYWGRGNSKGLPQEVTSDMSPGECVWGDPGEASDGVHRAQDWMEAPEGGATGVQAEHKKKTSKEKKRGQANGGCEELGQGGGHQGMEDASYQELYRGQSLEEEEAAALQDIQGEGTEDSQCELSHSSTEATDIGTSEGDPEINGNKGGGSKGHSEEGPERPQDCSQPNGGDREMFRTPGNGCSAEGLEMEQGNYPSGDPSRGRCEREWDGEMEEKNANPVSYQQLQLLAQNCPGPACHMGSVGQSSLEGCGAVEESGSWCWCLHLYLGDSEGKSHEEGDTAEEGQSRECAYSMSSTLRVGEHLDERDGDSGVNLEDIPEPLTKKAGKMGDTPELQEWVNWWQGWAGSCRAVSGRRRGKAAQAWGCRGEARGEGQKQQDVWVLREWARRDGGKRGENGPRVPGGEVWVLREQEEGKQESAWPLGKEDIWVPREPRKPRSAYFMADNTQWTPRSAKPGVSDKGEP